MHVNAWVECIKKLLSPLQVGDKQRCKNKLFLLQTIYGLISQDHFTVYQAICMLHPIFIVHYALCANGLMRTIKDRLPHWRQLEFKFNFKIKSSQYSIQSIAYAPTMRSIDPNAFNDALYDELRERAMQHALKALQNQQQSSSATSSTQSPAIAATGADDLSYEESIVATITACWQSYKLQMDEIMQQPSQSVLPSQVGNNDHCYQ